MENQKEGVKFKVKADLALFEAIQKNGRLSEEKIATKTNIPATTVHYAMKRIRQRDFFQIKAVPNMKKFQEIPLAVIGFSNVHPMKITKLTEYADQAEIVQFIHSAKDVVLYVMSASKDALTRKLFEMMELLNEKPSIYITSPNIAKFEVTIPDKVLEEVYDNLPDRRIRV